MKLDEQKKTKCYGLGVWRKDEVKWGVIKYESWEYRYLLAYLEDGVRRRKRKIVCVRDGESFYNIQSVRTVHTRSLPLSSVLCTVVLKLCTLVRTVRSYTLYPCLYRTFSHSLSLFLLYVLTLHTFVLTILTLSPLVRTVRSLSCYGKVVVGIS